VLPPKTPMHPFPEFQQACSRPGLVIVTQSALSTVERLGLVRISESVVDWIAAGGVENPQHLNTEIWRNNPDERWKIWKRSDAVVWVDAFIFESGSDEGYIAYLYRSQTQKWLVKSLKLNI